MVLDRELASLVGEPLTHVVVVTANVAECWGGSVAAPEFARITMELRSGDLATRDN